MRTWIFASILVMSLGGCGGQSGLPVPPGSANANAFAKLRTMPEATSGGFTTLFEFGTPGDQNAGGCPLASVTYDVGALYGTTTQCGSWGSVFGMSTSGTLSWDTDFSKTGASGFAPANNGLVATEGGVLYGTTQEGGSQGSGTFFSIDQTTGAQTVLHRFGDGVSPAGTLLAVQGTFYGVTANGGTNGMGSVYSISKTGTLATLYSFAGGSDGSDPQAGLIISGGVLYGTTSGGGTDADGTVYSITTAGVEKVLHSFVGGDDGQSPASKLVAVSGVLYGTTPVGGSYGYGTVFSITTSGTEAVTHNFGSGVDGRNPQSGLVELSNKLYGTTEYGGTGVATGGEGTIFRITTGGAETIVHDFCDECTAEDGQYPVAGLTVNGSTLYGTTSQGASYGEGTVFSMVP